MLEQVDSTNRYLADAAREGADEGLVIVAHEQSAGRGRLGRRWVAPRSSALLCSVLFRPALVTAQLHLVTVGFALAAVEGIAAAASVGVVLKWPNDLLVGEQKLGGILAEVLPAPVVGGTSPPGDRGALVVGIGINLAWPSSFGATEEERALLSSATTLRAQGADPGWESLLEAFLGALLRRYRSLESPEGRAQTMADYRLACSTIGREVRVLQVGGEWRGFAESITDEGHLMVRRGGEMVTLHAGDVVHLRSAPGQG